MPDFKLDETSSLPVWVQLRNRFVYLIKTGHYQSGDQLPSVRSLAAELSINYNTVSKTYVDLEHAGYVMSVRGRGVFVRETAESSREDMYTVVDTVIEDAIKRCMSMGMLLDEVKLRMMDVAYRMQEESGALAREKRTIYERNERCQSR